MGNEQSNNPEPIKSDFKPQVIEQSRNYDARYGQIKKVQDVKTNKKMILKDVVTNSKEDFEKELIFFDKRSKTSHPNLIIIYGFNVNDMQNFCATYFKLSLYIEVTEKNLETVLDNRIMQQNLYPEIDILQIAENMISALSFLQTLNRHHGDVHPKNVFITEDNIYKLSDPALCTNREDGLAAAILGIAKPFLSPQLMDNVLFKDFDTKSDRFKADVFSLGITLLSLATLKKSEEIYNYDTCKIDTELLFFRLEFVKKNYSKFTYDLIKQMLTINDNDRPDFVALSNKLLPYQDDIKKRIELPFFKLRENTFEDSGPQTPLVDLEKYLYEEKENPMLQEFIQNQLNTHAKNTARKRNENSNDYPKPPSEADDFEHGDVDEADVNEEMYYMGDVDGAHDYEVETKHHTPEDIEKLYGTVTGNPFPSSSVVINSETPFQQTYPNSKGASGSFALQTSQHVEINDFDSYTNLRSFIDQTENSKPNNNFNSSQQNFSYGKVDYTPRYDFKNPQTNPKPEQDVVSNVIKSDELFELDKRIQAALQRSEQTFKKLTETTSRSKNASFDLNEAPQQNFNSTGPANSSFRRSYDQNFFNYPITKDEVKPLSASDTFFTQNISRLQPSLNYQPMETQNVYSPVNYLNSQPSYSNNTEPQVDFNDPEDLNKYLDNILARSQSLISSSKNNTSNAAKIQTQFSRESNKAEYGDQKLYSVPIDITQQIKDNRNYIENYSSI